MKYHWLILFVLLLQVALPAYGAGFSTDPIAPRLIELCGKEDISDGDVAYLHEMASRGGPGECLARAVLFRHSESKFGDQFRRYFSIDRSAPVTVLTPDEVNSRVNGVIKGFSGRPPAEVVARVYLIVRGKGFVSRRADGTDLNLEVMLRGSVFAAVNKGSKEKTLHFAEEADKL